MSEAEEFLKKGLWHGGFIDSYPLAPVSWSSYTNTGFVSLFHAAYLACIKPFVHAGTVALEIGPGRGAWTKAIFQSGASKVIAVDVYDREHNGIDIYLGSYAERLEYLQITTADLSSIDDSSCNYFCSFGCFVHLSPDLQARYFRAIYSKLHAGAEGFVQVADADQWNKVCSDESLRIDNVLRAKDINGVIPENDWEAFGLLNGIKPRELVGISSREWTAIDPGRYFYIGVENAGELIRQAGLEVVDLSFIPSWRDPVIRFRKPA